MEMKELVFGEEEKELSLGSLKEVKIPEDVVFLSYIEGVTFVTTKKLGNTEGKHVILGVAHSREAAIRTALERVLTDHRKALEKLISVCNVLGLDSQKIIEEHAITTESVVGSYFDQVDQEITWTATSEAYLDNCELKLAIPEHSIHRAQMDIGATETGVQSHNATKTTQQEQPI